MKIETIDMVLKDGTIEQKIDLILSDIRDGESERELKNRNKLRMESMINVVCAGMGIDSSCEKFIDEIIGSEE